MMHLNRIFTGMCLAIALTLGSTQAAQFDHTHARLAKVLKTNVKDGWVNYRTLKSKPIQLQAYLRELALVKESQFNRWSKNEQLAFLYNLYNAATLQLILENYPVASIKKIGGFFSGPWKQKVVKLFGETTTLDHLEHGIIRKNYRDARAHFALVCAAKSCPPLRSEAYVASRLSEQLNDQGRIFLGQNAKNRLDAPAGRVYLSPIFKWFDEDFERQSGSVLKFVQPFFPKSQQAAFSRSLSIKYTDYDWSLNER
jgi:hypothetical protein